MNRSWISVTTCSCYPPTKVAARCGGVPELKALIQLSGLDEKRAIPRNSKPRGRSFADILMDNWRKEPLDEDASVGAAGPDG